MANQRIYIRCGSCGAEKFFAKRMMGAFYTIGTWTPSDWDEWFETHEWGFCGDNAKGLDIFSLVYEHVDEDGSPRGV